MFGRTAAEGEDKIERFKIFQSQICVCAASTNLLCAKGSAEKREIMKNKEVKITTIIGKGAECNGDFNAEGSVRIDGTINGNVTVSGTLIVGTTGSISGDVEAHSAIVGGEIIGDVRVTDRTELTGTARLIGNITTVVIVIDENAIFQGSCNMNQEVPGKRARPTSKAVRAGKKSAKEAIEEALKEVEAANREETIGISESNQETSLF